MKKLAIFLTMLVMALVISCNARLGDKESAYGRDVSLSYDEITYTTSFAGTGYNGSGTMPAFRYMSNLYGEAAEGFPQQNTPSESAILNENERKLVKRATIRIRVESLETADSSITGMMNNYNGYAAMTEFEENSRHYSLRIPTSRYESFIFELEGVGRLLRRTENIEDVTVRYYDLEGRLESKKELLRTFQSYLGRAKNMEEILAVESRIAELQYDIDFTGTQLRDLANKIDYATIELYLLGPVAQTVYKGDTFGEKIKRLFGGFGSFLTSATVFLLGFIIYGLPILALIILLIWLLFGRVGLMKKLWQLIMVKKVPVTNE